MIEPDPFEELDLEAKRIKRNAAIIGFVFGVIAGLATFMLFVLQGCASSTRCYGF